MIYHEERLAMVDDDLVRVVRLVGAARDVDVACGARFVADEQAAIDSGKSHLRNPLSSLHVVNPPSRPKALAVDLTSHPVDWNDHQSFVDLAIQMKSAASSLEVPITWGGDWGWDFDHFQRKLTP